MGQVIIVHLLVVDGLDRNPDQFQELTFKSTAGASPPTGAQIHPSGRDGDFRKPASESNQLRPSW